MGKVGFTVSTIFAIGLAAGLAFSSYHMSENIDSKAEFYKNFVNKPSTQIAMKYNEVSNLLDETFDKYILELYKYNEFPQQIYDNLSEATKLATDLNGSDVYVDRLLEVNKDILLLKNVENNPQLYKDIESEVLALNKEIKAVATSNEPNIDSIEDQINHYKNRYVGCILGIVFGSIGVAALGSTSVYHGCDVVSNISSDYSKRRRTRNKV